jgi:hypothetical protein
MISAYVFSVLLFCYYINKLQEAFCRHLQSQALRFPVQIFPHINYRIKCMKINDTMSFHEIFIVDV